VTGLVTGATQAGLATSLSTTGRPRPLPAEVDLAAYRIIQESLTNAVRHAGPATAAVSLSYGDAELRIEVADNGLGSPAVAGDGAGHGLIGMRERASSVGGTVEAAPRPQGGFLVAARLPIDRQPDAAAEAAGEAATAGSAPAEQGAPP
jgi:signal transduction histidine kinase